MDAFIIAVAITIFTVVIIDNVKFIKELNLRKEKIKIESEKLELDFDLELKKLENIVEEIIMSRTLKEFTTRELKEELDLRKNEYKEILAKKLSDVLKECEMLGIELVNENDVSYSINADSIELDESNSRIYYSENERD